MAEMDSIQPDLESTDVKVALAFAAYQSDGVRVVETSVAGTTHILASRQGLFAINEHECRLLIHGFFFGITLHGGQIFVFEACDLPREPTRRGRLIQLTVRDQTIVAATVLHKALDNGCHQIDFIDASIIVVDTYNQQILRFHNDSQQIYPDDPQHGFGRHFQTCGTLRPLPVSPPGRSQGIDPAYRHANSVLAVGDRILLLLHNGADRTGRDSEIVVYNRDWRELERWPLRGSGCHGLALLEDGSVLTCGSMEGTLITTNGWSMRVSPYLTRGLAVGPGSVVVGASRLVEREGRLRNSGTVTFMDRDPATGLPAGIRTVLEVPGAPTEIRRLDAQDAGLSAYLAAQPWGATLKRRA